MAKKFVVDKNEVYAILTGDIVGSSKLTTTQRKKLLGILKKTSQELRRMYKNIVPFKIDIFRGDSWQLFVADPKFSLRIALLFRSTLKGKMDIRGFDSKIFIGVGTIDSLPGERVSLGHGEAFILSGRGLENLRKNRMGIDYPAFDKNDYLKVIIELVDVFASNWTVKQSIAIRGALKDWSQQRIAESWEGDELTQQAVQKHLVSSHWSAIESVLNKIEAA